MTEILYVSGAISVALTILLEFVKTVFEGRINTRYLPVVAVVIGVLLAIGTVLIPEIAYDVSVPALALAGAIAGLAASGLYDLSIKPFKKD